ncbi:hypothetical protein CEQ90_12030 [Lewinellaceae bacterium SD302]|nr:hypothetical protein CEQ90_12030 [Lewinellaceae bacterium SD302]
MSMIKNLKSLFIVEEAGASKPKAAKTLPPKPAPKAAPKSGTPTEAPGTTPPAAGERPGQATKKFTDILLAALEKANQPGFDYLEFKKSLQNLKKLNMDDSTRFQSAYATAQSMNITPTQLINSAGHYLKVLAQEDKNFNTALNGQQQRQIKDQQAQLPKLDQEIKSLEEQIEQLQARIKKAKADQSKIRKSIESADVKLRNTHNDFQASYRAIAAQIEGDVESMKQYLK